MLQEKEKQQLNEQLKNYSDRLRIPGMAIMAHQDGEKVYEYYYGFRDEKEELLVNGDTVFGVASITKSFAALAIMQLQDAGKLSVLDPVQKWLPHFALPNDGASDKVTIHHLMTHTAGLPGMYAVHLARLQSILDDPDGSYLFAGDHILHKDPISTVDDMVEIMKNTEVSLLGQPGEMFNYSNEAYALLQTIIEEASGEDFLTYMDKHVFEPLQMNRSTFLQAKLEEMDNVTEIFAYDKTPERKVFHSPSWWDVGEIYTNGSLKASVSDLMNYVDMYVGNGKFQGKTILSKDSVEQMTTPHVITPNDVEYGYGFIIGEVGGYKTFGHGGGIKGVSSFMLAVPEKKLSIVVLINIAEAPAENMALQVMRQLLKLEKEKNDLPTIDVSKEQLETYCGKYRSQEGQEVHAEINEEGQLQLLVGVSTIPLRPVADHEFLTQDNKKITFIVENGKVKAIFRGLRYIEKE
ncbi:MAG TPA: serine hydrolase domain-containing protein [Bacillota bacterium]|nr:serine hydrolase domain-containing protein [Bacillota bacterium]